MKQTERFYFFWQHQFGQWTKRNMEDVDGITYNCCEQYMMAKKAQLFNDENTLQKIMATDSPKLQQALGREVQNFNADKWDKHKYAIVWSANYLKFTQHQDLAERLLATENRIIAEASPYDLVWGIGYEAEDPDALNMNNWKGQNLLGEVLMSIRNTLLVI